MYLDLTDKQTRRFLSRIWQGSTLKECWRWTAGKCIGYGRFKINGQTKWAHRVSYELFIDKIPNKLVLDHLCRNPICVNPTHLEPVTQKENILRGKGVASNNSRKTHCPQGHEYNDKNTHNYLGKRVCKPCGVIKVRKWRENRNGS